MKGKPKTSSKEASPDQALECFTGLNLQISSSQKLKKKICEVSIDKLKEKKGKIRLKHKKTDINSIFHHKELSPKAKEFVPKPLSRQVQNLKALGWSNRSKTPDKLGILFLLLSG